MGVNEKAMQFESLKVFCDVARNRSFSQAAAANDVTQSAVSQIISQLEKRVGVQLIDRSTRPLQLTPLGRAYYEGCRQLLEQYSELEASLRSAQARIEGIVQIAAIYSVGLGDMGQYIEAFRQQEPSAEVHIEYLHPKEVYEKVLSGEADLGLVSFPRKSPKLTVVPWREELMVLACAPGHPLAERRSLGVGELEDQAYVHFSKDLMIRREVDRFLHRHGTHVRVVLEFDNIENIKKAVEIAAGVALLPEPTFRQEVSAGTLRAVPLALEEESRLVRPLGIIYRRHHRLCSTARKFLDMLCAQGADAPRAGPAGVNGDGALPADPGSENRMLPTEHQPGPSGGRQPPEYTAGRRGARRPSRKKHPGTNR